MYVIPHHIMINISMGINGIWLTVMILNDQNSMIIDLKRVEYTS